MKKTLLVVSIVLAFVFTMGYAFAAEAPAAPAAPAAEVKAAEAPKAPEAPAAPAAAVTEEVVVGKLVVAAEKVTIAVEGKEAVAVKKDAKVAEIEKIEKFADKTFEFKGTFATEKVKEGDKEVEVKLFVISAFAEKAAEAPKAEEKK